MIRLEPALLNRLIDQAYALATYLLDHHPEPSEDEVGYLGVDRDPIERAADHVARLAGYQGSDAVYVADVVYCLVRSRTGRPPVSSRKVDQMPEHDS